MAFEIDEGFGHWLAGFADGEGCFRVIVQRKPLRIVCSFNIGLMGEDLAILEEIQRRTGIGTVYCSRPPSHFGREYAQWRVVRKEDCLRLVEIFERYPLRAKKQHDFVIWATAVRAHNARQQGGTWEPVLVAADDLKALRSVKQKVVGG